MHTQAVSGAVDAAPGHLVSVLLIDCPPGHADKHELILGSTNNGDTRGTACSPTPGQDGAQIPESFRLQCH